MCIGARRMKNHKSRLNFLFSDAKRKRGTTTATTFRLQFEFKLNNPTARTLLSLSTPCSHSPHALFQKCSFKTNKTLSWIVSGKRGHGRKEDCIRREGDFVQRGNFSILFGKVNILRGYRIRSCSNTSPCISILETYKNSFKFGNVGKKLLCKWRDFYYVWCWKRAHHVKNQWCDARKLPKSRRQKTTLLGGKTLEIHSAAAFANAISMCMSNSLNWSSNHVNE